MLEYKITWHNRHGAESRCNQHVDKGSTSARARARVCVCVCVCVWGDVCVACITARTKEFARASATSLRFLSNGGTPLLSRTLHDYVHFLPLPREYVRTYICTYVCSAGTGFDAFQRTRLLFRLHSPRTEREPDAIASAMHLSIVRTGRKFFLFPRRSFYDVHSYSRRRRQVGTLLRLEKLPVDLYLRG